MPTIILFAPLIGALICGFGWRLIGEKAGQVEQISLRIITLRDFDGSVHIRLIPFRNLADDFFRCWINRFESFSGQGRAPLSFDKTLGMFDFGLCDWCDNCSHERTPSKGPRIDRVRQRTNLPLSLSALKATFQWGPILCAPMQRF